MMVTHIQKSFFPGFFSMLLALVVLSGCDSKEKDASASPWESKRGAFVKNKSGDEEVLRLDERWTGDFGGMLERRKIRVLVVFSKTFYFLDRGHQRGVTYEAFKAFEKTVNKQIKAKTLKVHLIFIPVSRDELIPALVEGRGDIAAANLTITPERKKLVDFSDAFFRGVSEIIVTGSGAPSLRGKDDLAGKEIYVRASSSYYASLLKLNRAFRQAGKPQMKLTLADENLEDEDLLEMVNAGLIPIVVIDSHKGRFWDQIFDRITLHPDIALRTGGQIAWAFRKNSPKLKKSINSFVKKNKKGTLLGNILFKRYLRDTLWVKNSLSGKDLEKFRGTTEFFKQYAGQYGFDHLMITALAYQESQLDQSKRSPAGAIGVMQLLPSTAADSNVNITNINKLKNNIHAGVKYLRFIYDRYFNEEEMDYLNKVLFTFASYNAGPAKVTKLRREAAKIGLDPNKWFRNVEMIAAKRIGRETVQYVSNIYKYYIAYRMVSEQKKLKDAAMRPK